MFKHNVIKIPVIDSTNSYALSLKDTRAFKEGLVIVSDFQTNGHGQRETNWESEKGKNLNISVLIEPKILIERQFDISILISLSIIDCLTNLGIKSMIKWPNDILVRNKKIAGILIQNIISSDIITHSVIGIGLNVNQLIFETYTPKATSVTLELNKDLIVEELQNSLLNIMHNRLNDYRSGIDIKFHFLNKLFKKDMVSFFQNKSQKFNGIIRGVSEMGLLIIETESEVKEFNLKEIRMLF